MKISRNLANGIFILFIIAIAALIALFLATGLSGLLQRTYQDLSPSVLPSTTWADVIQYAYNPQFFAQITTIPIFIITSIELVAWIFLLTFGYLDKPKNMFMVMVLYFSVMGLMIWYYSIF